MEGAGKTFDVARLLAPGTELTAEGAGVTQDKNDDDNGVSTSDLANFTATVDWGDGSEPTAAVFRTDAPRTSLRASGEYILSGGHTYATPGVYTGAVNGSDGRSAAFEVTVAALPVAEISLSRTSAAPGATVTVTGTGYDANEAVAINLGDALAATTVAGDDGSFETIIAVPGSTPWGETTVTATGDASNRSDTATLIVAHGCGAERGNGNGTPGNGNGNQGNGNNGNGSCNGKFPPRP